jgi:hypothetical protein
MSASDIAQFDFRQIDSQTRDWTSVCYTPLKQADYDFTDNPSGFTGGAQKQGVDPRPILGILCESASTSIPLPFEFQIVAHYEAIGAKARGKTISNTDVTATLKAVSAVTQGPPGLSTAIFQSQSIGSNGCCQGSDRRVNYVGRFGVKSGFDLGWLRC